MKTVILDTNFLLIPFTESVDIFEELKHLGQFPYELAVFDKTIDELKKLSKDKELSGKERKAADLALQSLKIYKIKTLKSEREGYADFQIIEYAKNNPNVVVATQDSALKRELRHLRVPLIVLRQRNHLVYQPY